MTEVNINRLLVLGLKPFKLYFWSIPETTPYLHFARDIAVVVFVIEIGLRCVPSLIFICFVLLCLHLGSLFRLTLNIHIHTVHRLQSHFKHGNLVLPSFTWSYRRTHGRAADLWWSATFWCGKPGLLKNRSTCLWRQRVKQKETINSLIWVANRKGSFHIYIKTIL